MKQGEIRIKNSLEELPENIANKLVGANVFFSQEYFDYAKLCGHEMMYAYGESYIVPICIYSKLFLKYALFVSEPYSYVGNKSVSSLQEFLDKLVTTLKSTRIAWISTSAGCLFEAYPKKSTRIPFGSHVVDLTLSEEELWSNVHSKHRNSIRRAEKGGVEIKYGAKDLIEDYIKLDKETWARSGKNSYGESFFEKMVDGLEDNVRIVVAYKDEQPQAGGVFFLNQQTSYYMYGTSADHPEPGSANLLQWKTMLKFKEDGVKRYSFVGCRINEDKESKYHGIQQFKERFGGKLEQGYMFRTVLNPFQYRLFKAMYKIKNKKELLDPIDMEVHKWRDLNE